LRSSASLISSLEVAQTGGEARKTSFSLQRPRKGLPRAAALGLSGCSETPEMLLKQTLFPEGESQPASLSISLPCTL